MEQKMIYVGIDWADDHHDIVITDDSAKTPTCSGSTIPAMGLPCFIHTLQTIRHLPASFLVAAETSRGLLVHKLLQKGYIVYAINKDRHVLLKAKSDALSLGHLLRTDRHLFQPIKPLPEDLVSNKKYFGIFSKNINNINPDRVDSRISCFGFVFSDLFGLGLFLDQLTNLKEHITHYEQEIQTILDNLPESNSIKSLPGAGERLAPELVATLGPNRKDGHHRFMEKCISPLRLRKIPQKDIS